MDQTAQTTTGRVRRFSPAVDAALRAAPENVQHPIGRTFALLDHARIGAAHVSVPFVQLLVRTASAVLASLAAGEVPPLTFPGRFRGLDEVFARLVQAAPGAGPAHVLDVGCGFPPVTSMELAEHLPGAEVVALDPGLPHGEAVLPDGTRAFFDEQRRFRFAVAGGMLVVKQDPPGEVERRAVAFAADHPESLRDALAFSAAGRVRLVRVRAGDEGVDFGPVRAIRAMNVLPYLQPEERAAFFAWAERVLEEGGLVLEGVSFMAGAEIRFSLHEKRNGALSRTRAGFTVDCLRSFGPLVWMELRGDPGPSDLARLVGEARRDNAFRDDFDRFADAQLARRGLLERRSDGFLHALAPLSPAELGAALSGMVEALDQAGFTARAARVLSAAGVPAVREGAGIVMVNCVARARHG